MKSVGFWTTAVKVVGAKGSKCSPGPMAALVSPLRFPRSYLREVGSPQHLCAPQGSVRMKLAVLIGTMLVAACAPKVSEPAIQSLLTEPYPES